MVWLTMILTNTMCRSKFPLRKGACSSKSLKWYHLDPNLPILPNLSDVAWKWNSFILGTRCDGNIIIIIVAGMIIAIIIKVITIILSIWSLCVLLSNQWSRPLLLAVCTPGQEVLILWENHQTIIRVIIMKQAPYTIHIFLTLVMNQC